MAQTLEDTVTPSSWGRCSLITASSCSMNRGTSPSQGPWRVGGNLESLHHPGGHVIAPLQPLPPWREVPTATSMQGGENPRRRSRDSHRRASVYTTERRKRKTRVLEEKFKVCRVGGNGRKERGNRNSERLRSMVTNITSSSVLPKPN